MGTQVLSAVQTIGQREGVLCKYCSSEQVVGYGWGLRGHRRYRCNSCRRTFVNNGAPSGMRYSIPFIALALNQFYEGASLRSIQRLLMLQHGVQPDHAVIRRWALQYTQQAVSVLAGIRPWASEAWIVDENRLRTRHQTIWVWDIVDVETRFLLATGFSAKRSALDFSSLLELAIRRTGAGPKTMFVNSPFPLRKVDAEQKRMAHTGVNQFQAQGVPNSMRRIVGALRQRDQIFERIRKTAVAHLLISGWSVHYNFFCRQPELKGKTPAEAAQVDSPLKSWTDVVGL